MFSSNLHIMILLTKTKQLTRKRVLIPSNIYWFSIKLNFTPPPKKNHTPWENPGGTQVNELFF